MPSSVTVSASSRYLSASSSGARPHGSDAVGPDVVGRDVGPYVVGLRVAGAGVGNFVGLRVTGLGVDDDVGPGVAGMGVSGDAVGLVVAGTGSGSDDNTVGLGVVGMEASDEDVVGFGVTGIAVSGIAVGLVVAGMVVSGGNVVGTGVAGMVVSGDDVVGFGVAGVVVSGDAIVGAGDAGTAVSGRNVRLGGSGGIDPSSFAIRDHNPMSSVRSPLALLLLLLHVSIVVDAILLLASLFFVDTMPLMAEFPSPHATWAQPPTTRARTGLDFVMLCRFDSFPRVSYYYYIGTKAGGGKR